MQSKKVIAALIVATIIASIALVGCEKKEESNKEIASVTGMDKEQYLVVSLKNEPRTLDGSKSNDSYSTQVLQDCIEGLTRIETDKDGKDIIKAAGAESWSKSEDGLTWTFKLRDNTWSDGKKVTAEDYAYGIKRTIDPGSASNYAFLSYPIKGAVAFNSKKAGAEVVGVKAIDEKTLEIKLEKPCAYFLDLTYFRTWYPQRKDIVEKYGDKYGTEANTLVFNGPFVIKEWVHSNKIELEKNEKYWDAKSVKLQNVTFKIIKEEQAKMNELLTGSLDVSAVTKTEWSRKFDESGKYNVVKGFNPSSVCIFFNEKEKLLSNLKIRQAFSLSITREDIAKEIYRDLGSPAYGWCPPTLQIGGKDFREQVNYEPLKKLAEQYKDPKALFIEGLKELGMETDSSKISVSFLQSGTDAQSREFAEYFQQMWSKALGITVKVEYIEWPLFQKRTDGMEYQLAVANWVGDYNDPMTFFDMWMSDAGIAPTGYASKEYDDIIKKAQNTLEPKVRLEAFKAAEQKLLVDDCVFAPIIYRMRNVYSYKFVKGTMNPMFGAGDKGPDFKYAYTEGRGK